MVLNMILNSTNSIDKVNFNIIKTKKNLIFFIQGEKLIKYKLTFYYVII